MSFVLAYVCMYVFVCTCVCLCVFVCVPHQNYINILFYTHLTKKANYFLEKNTTENEITPPSPGYPVFYCIIYSMNY